LITPGLDFALTEVVHCKSRNEVGVKEAQEFCSKRYLDRILSVSAAKVIVVFGQSAKDVVVHQLSSSMRPLFDGERNLFAQKQRMIVFLAHPAGFGRKKSVKDSVGDDGLRLLRNHLREHRMGRCRLADRRSKNNRGLRPSFSTQTRAHCKPGQVEPLNRDRTKIKKAIAPDGLLVGLSSPASDRGWDK
jgi:hypothetical protein